MAIPFYKSGAKFSAIVGIGEKIKKLSKETGQEYLMLNRGINAVTNIDLSKVIKLIDFNSGEIQYYPPARGHIELKNAINKSYFQDSADLNQILVTAGGTMGLDLLFQTLQVEKFYLPLFFWGTYAQILTIRKKSADFYESYEQIEQNIKKYPKSAFVFCDPNNPLGNKYDDEKMFNLISQLNDAGHIIIWDSPYRRVFTHDNDDFFYKLSKLENVIINESFSKALGLSGQRIGFIFNQDTNFMEELVLRLLFATNGINAFAQKLVTLLLSTPEGKNAVDEFKRITVNGIKKNIELLQKKELLAKEFYTDTSPMGIFVIVNKSQDELLEKRIGSVSLSYFTKLKPELGNKYARISVSVPPDKFEKFFSSF
jgi:aspartate aminotransferase